MSKPPHILHITFKKSLPTYRSQDSDAQRFRNDPENPGTRVLFTPDMKWVALLIEGKDGKKHGRLVSPEQVESVEVDYDDLEGLVGGHAVAPTLGPQGKLEGLAKVR